MGVAPDDNVRSNTSENVMLNKKEGTESSPIMDKSLKGRYNYNHRQNYSGVTVTVNGGIGREASSPREQRAAKFASKSRGGGYMNKAGTSNGDFVMLQRPTILSKTTAESPDDRPKPINGPPVVVTSRSTELNNQEVTKPAESNLTPPDRKPAIIKPIGRPTPDIEPPATNPIKAYTDSIGARLGGQPTPMTTSVRLLDENLSWHDGLAEYLIPDNNGFLVVGVLGKKGTGKSTLMSMLAGDGESVFRVSSDSAKHCTTGINAFITCERTILLDVQPLLSASVLDRAISQSIDKKQPTGVPDFKYYENLIELQSLELACFVLSVCNVVIITEDWFCDPNMIRLLQTAEMLLPNMNSVFAQSAQDELLQQHPHAYDHHPHLIYVLNKSEFVGRHETARMKSVLHTLLHESKLFSFKGSLTSPDAVNNGYSSRIGSQRRRHATGNDWESVNFVCMPKMEPAEDSPETMNEFKGLPAAHKCAKSLMREILGIKRTNCVFMNPNTGSLPSMAASGGSSSNRDQIFTEKRWFNFANKVWEAIRKSSLIAEYNRLMT